MPGAGSSSPAELVASCDFQVEVILDVEAPVLTCPSEVTWQATSCEGAEPSSLPVSATDALWPVSVTYGEQLDVLLLPVGDRMLTVTAVDAAGNSARCEVLVARQAAAFNRDGRQREDGEGVREQLAVLPLRR